MGVTALVMAGGKGTRMAFREEKPLLEVGGKPMIVHVLEALGDAKNVSDVVVAVSRHTPNTAKFVGRFPVKVLKTPGVDYVSDMKYAVKALNLETVLTISADLPLISGETIDKTIEEYWRSGKPALTVAVLMEMKERLGLLGEPFIEATGRRKVPSGINVINGRRIDEAELEEEIFVIDEEETAVNVNTPQDLGIAERMFAKKHKRKN